MKEEAKTILKGLLTARRVLALAVTVDQRPHVGMLPFAFDRLGPSLLVHASRLAAHTRGMDDGAPFGAMIHAPDDPPADPLQIPRVVVHGRVERCARDDDGYADARAAYLAKLPSAAMVMELGDFELYRLRVEDGRLVIGFAQTHNFGPSTLSSLDD